ncbi:MAG: diguanylate cyclase [Gammaproteobacteria bacterium]|nr:diguanylate cyclase [Gammaproteobacteria bacterium]
MTEDPAREVEHSRWYHLAHAAGEALLVLDTQLRIRWLNASAEGLFSVTADTARGMLFDTLLDSTTDTRRSGRVHLLENLLALEPGRPSKLYDLAMRRFDGALFVAEGAASRYEVPGGSETGIVMQLRDVTRQHQESAELQLSAKVFEHSGEAIMITDTLDRILSVNAAFTAMTGYDLDEVLGSSPAFLRQGLQEDAIYKCMWDAVCRDGHWKGEVHNRTKNGEVYPAWLALTAVRDKSGEIIHYISIFSDITERKARDEHIRFLAEHDYLTGLPNRVLLRDRFEQTVNLAKRDDPHPIAVFFMDLDGFKSINDTAGHAVGDQVLKEVAKRLQRSLRATDSIARHGGDEFILLLSNLYSREVVFGIADKLIRAIAQPFEVDGNAYRISVSVGISFYREHGEDLDQLIACADHAMYLAKQKGKNTWVVHSNGPAAHSPVAGMVLADVDGE